MDLHKRRLLAGATPSKPGSGATDANPIPSSSPAFATPAGPVRPAAAVPEQQQQQHRQRQQLPILPPSPNRRQHQNAGDRPPPRETTTATTMSRPSAATTATTILPVSIPPATLRPLAFRVFTKRHNLTLQASALAALAAFVGRHCGAGWRDEGLAERALDEAARRWKRAGGALIVEDSGAGSGGGGESSSSSDLAVLLKDLAACMVGGKVVADKPIAAAAATGSLNRQTSFGISGMKINDGSSRSAAAVGNGAISTTGQDEEMRDDGDDGTSTTRRDPRAHLKVIDAFSQPRLFYNATKRHFERATRPASLFPDPGTRTAFFKQRHHMVQQRLMRNEAFQAPTSVATRRAVPSLQRAGSSFVSQQSYRLSSVTDLLGRPGSGHLLLGLLSVAPAGHYVVSDLSGSIALDLSDAAAEPDWAWIVPGMMVLVDGTYEEDGVDGGVTMIGSNTGIGGTIGGRFITTTITGPPAERREKTLGIAGARDMDEFTAASGFGWVDFLGVGSEKTAGPRMRKIEKQFQETVDPGGRGRVIIAGELNLDVPETLDALTKILGTYEHEEPGTTPLAFILTGNFVSTAGMPRRGKAGSIEYKESFDHLASTLSDFPRLLSSATFVLVPGDNDPWASSFTASASTVIPRQAIPATFTSRIRRVFQQANAEREKTATSNIEGEAIFASNPARLSLFGPTQEMVILRDDMTGRVRRNLVSLQTQIEESEADSDKEESSMQMDTQAASNEPEIPDTTKSKPRDKISETDVMTARQLTKMIVDQAYLTPFSILKRPVLWDYGPALHMVPLPTALVIMDTKAPPFALGYEGCFVMNPGRCLVENRKGQARWIEYDTVTRRGRTLQVGF